MSVPARRLEEAVAKAPTAAKRISAAPLTAGPRRTVIDLFFIFTSYNPDAVYVLLYKSEVHESQIGASVTPNKGPRLIKVTQLTKKFLERTTFQELLVIRNEHVESLLAQQQVKKILDKQVFTFAVEDVDNSSNGIKTPDGKLKPEFVEALFKRDQARLDEIVKSRDIEI